MVKIYNITISERWQEKANVSADQVRNGFKWAFWWYFWWYFSFRLLLENTTATTTK